MAYAHRATHSVAPIAHTACVLALAHPRLQLASGVYLPERRDASHLANTPPLGVNTCYPGLRYASPGCDVVPIQGIGELYLLGFKLVYLIVR